MPQQDKCTVFVATRQNRDLRRSALEDEYPGCYSEAMNKDFTVSHERTEETPEAKTRWFCSLRMSDRMQMLCDLTDLALSINPSLPEKNRAQSTSGRIQVISAT
jgi:hypothetical protein